MKKNNPSKHIERPSRPAYVTDVTMTIDEYTRMAMKVTEKSRRLIIAIAETIWILLGAAAFVMKQYSITVFLGVTIIAYPLLIDYLYKRKLKKTFAALPAGQNEHIRYEFYPDHVLLLTNHGDGSYKYSDFIKMLETKDEIVLLLSRDQGLLILKENCSQELLDFLRGKFPK